ncbi:alkaline phosphatase [Nocardioides sp. GY 10113]|uniref:alkaline phosphatase D family protein n=1 Tax=Nocardioides sp. GY 10113 TaxID=2569761 RepID=UPI0010A7672A|nr:alkaline phosphatase D family protein [Nocardioides sp. GY 10113]TIC82256.1 alkaline phosphatase [Nocardioides sp. GY 10113]
MDASTPIENHLTPAPLVSRRRVIAGATVAGAVVATGALAAGSAGAEGATFAHGVASGDPLPDAVVLWTRVTPTAASKPGSGVGPAVAVTWEVARDPGFGSVVASGSIRTTAARDHTVKIDAVGLEPSTWYYYRFRVDGATSPVGRTRTAPPYESSPDRLRFGVVSCANLQAGYFHAYRALAQRDDLDAIIHLGDYIYEYGPGEYGYGKDDVDVRSHVPAREMVSLADYRKRHAQYKQDADLAALHVRLPFIATWDDHEFADNTWQDGAENHDPATEGSWQARRAAAFQAYDEWMPVRLSGTAAVGDGTQIYRRLRFGRLLELSMLDLSSYRTEEISVATMTGGQQKIAGAAQMEWLASGLRDSPAQWKLVGNPVMIAPVDFGTLPRRSADALAEMVGEVFGPEGLPYNLDQWDGYVRDRRSLYQFLRDNRVSDVVFLTGDIHSAWASDLPIDPGAYPWNWSTVGVEMVCTSVTSNNFKDMVGTTALSPVAATAIRIANPHIKFCDLDNHGYSVLDVTARRTQMDWYVTADRATRDSSSTWVRSFQTIAGTRRLMPAFRPVR